MLAICHCPIMLKAIGFPIFRNHPHLSLLIARLQFHANPILTKWAFTFASRSATRSVMRGSGVS